MSICCRSADFVDDFVCVGNITFLLRRGIHYLIFVSQHLFLILLQGSILLIQIAMRKCTRVKLNLINEMKPNLEKVLKCCA